MFRYRKIGFITCLDIWYDEELFCSSKDYIKCLHENKQLDKKQYNFKLVEKSFLLDISRNIDDIFSGFSYKSCKYAINKAKRDGINVWKADTQNDKNAYKKFQNSFCVEKGFVELGDDELEQLDVFCAETHEHLFLGGCAFVTSKDNKTVRYKHGATLHKYNANEAIIWEAIQYYHSRGFIYFDFGGVVLTDDKQSYYYHHYKFKEKFGGELIDSYTYFVLKGGWKIFYCIFNVFLKYFWKKDFNSFVNWLNQHHLIR